eukprot:2220439-Prorocentrum_lima.AAC.1
MVEITPTQLRKTLRKCKRGCAADVFGWCYEHLQAIIVDPHALSAAAYLMSQIVSGALTTRGQHLMGYAKLTPLAKEGGKIRPIAGVSTLRRTADA